MDIFPKIAKTILALLILLVIYVLAVDFGKSYTIEGHNNFIARNAASYVSKFTVDETSLLEQKNKSITKEETAESLYDYFRLMYQDVDSYTVYKYVHTGNNYKLIFIPRENVAEKGKIIVRWTLEGFGSSGQEKGVGIIKINIEEKLPSGIRNMMITSPNTDIKADNDGEIGYYSIIAAKGFTINTLKKYDE